MRRSILRPMTKATASVQTGIEALEALFTASDGCEELWRQRKVDEQIKLLKEAASGLMGLLTGEPAVDD